MEDIGKFEGNDPSEEAGAQAASSGDRIGHPTAREQIFAAEDQVFATRVHVADAPEASLPAGSCTGCHSLAERIERLEKMLAEMQAGSLSGKSQLGTTACYWILIAAHAFAVLCMLTGGLAAMAAYPFLIGSVATVAVCHALPIRTVTAKCLRTMLSCFLVSSCGLIALGALGAEGLGPILLITLPVLFLPALLTAQMFVWIGGWRILPPGKTLADKPPIRIMDYLLVTVLVACYTAAFRYVDFEDLGLSSDSETWGYVGLVALASCVFSLSAVLSARGFLAPGVRIAKRWVVGAVALLLFVGTPLAALTFEDSFGFSNLLMFLFYGVLSVVFILISPIGSFFLMRLANYRIVSLRSQAAEARQTH